MSGKLQMMAWILAGIALLQFASSTGCVKSENRRSVDYVKDTSCINKVQRLEWKVDRLEKQIKTNEIHIQRLSIDLEEAKGEF